MSWFSNVVSVLKKIWCANAAAGCFLSKFFYILKYVYGMFQIRGVFYKGDVSMWFNIGLEFPWLLIKILLLLYFNVCLVDDIGHLTCVILVSSADTDNHIGR